VRSIMRNPRSKSKIPDTRARILEVIEAESPKDGRELVEEVEKVLAEVNAKLKEDERLAAGEQPDWVLHPMPALKDGEPIVASTLRDGRKVLIAADGEGKPFKDKFGQYVVIDPQSGHLRYKLGARSGHQARNTAAPAFNSNGLDAAQKRFEKFDLGALAFIRAMRPVKDLYKVRTRKERVLLAFIKLVATIVFFVRKPLLLAKAKYRAFKNRKYQAGLRVERLPGVEKYLTADALKLLNNEIPTFLYEVRGPSKLGFARTVSIMVPLETDGSISDEYVRRWARMMNDLEARGIWRYGTLMPPSTMKVAQSGLKFEKLLMMMIFTDQVADDSKLYGNSLKALNDEVKYPLFQLDGQIPSEETNWYDFPW